jgi:hypothetical protein
MLVFVLWYLVIGIVTSAFVSQKAIARIASYGAGEAILVSGTSKAHAAERARTMIPNYALFKDADTSKYAGLIVGGFVGTLIAWPGFLYTAIFYREHVRIQNGVVLD